MMFEARLLKLDDFISSLKILDFSLEHTRLFGALRAELIDKGSDSRVSKPH